MFNKNCIFHLVLLCCHVFSSYAYPTVETSKAIDTTSYTLGVGHTETINGQVSIDMHCSAGRIGNGFILTSASCVMNATNNIQNFFGIQALPNREFYMVPFVAVYVPRTYNATTLRDNIAVVKLLKNADIRKTVKKLEIPDEAVKVGSHAKMTTENVMWHYDANIVTIDNKECRNVYPNLVENGTLCAKFDGTKRTEDTTYALPGSVAVVDGKTLVGLLSRRSRDLSKYVDDVQRYTDVYSHADFISNAMNNVTKNMHYCINKQTDADKYGSPIVTCEDTWG